MNCCLQQRCGISVVWLKRVHQFWVGGGRFLVALKRGYFHNDMFTALCSPNSVSGSGVIVFLGSEFSTDRWTAGCTWSPITLASHGEVYNCNYSDPDQSWRISNFISKNSVAQLENNFERGGCRQKSTIAADGEVCRWANSKKRIDWRLLCRSYSHVKTTSFYWTVVLQWCCSCQAQPDFLTEWFCWVLILVSMRWLALQQKSIGRIMFVWILNSKIWVTMIRNICILIKM